MSVPLKLKFRALLDLFRNKGKDRLPSVSKSVSRNYTEFEAFEFVW